MARSAGLSAALVALPLLADGAALFAHGSTAGAGVPPCAACHGVDGHGRSGPALAGLTARGVLSNLSTLAAGGGDNVVMQGIAQRLTPAQRVAVAGYIATLK